MQRTLNDFSPASLVSSIEESLREFWINWGSAPQSELYAGLDMVRLYTGVPYAFCNGVICSRLSSGNINMKIEETLSYYRKRNATWEWMVGPDPIPASLNELLIDHGLCEHGASVGMAIDLHSLNQHIPQIDGLSIAAVSDDNALETWTDTMIGGFESPALYPAFVDLERSLGYHQPSYRRYLGTWHHQPVSTCALYLGENVAGVYCVSTLPKARRLGIGAAVTHFALHQAQAEGYRIAVLQSTPMGRNVYRQLGFQEFSTLRCYRLVS